MADLNDINLPSFSLFPAHTDRTAYRPFGLPVILVVPHIRNSAGIPISNANVTQVTISIDDAGPVPISGHENIGKFKPDESLFTITIQQAQLVQRIVSQSIVTYLDAEGNETTEDVAEFIEFTAKSGVRDRIQYLPHADYYDLSDVTIETEQLPVGKYMMSYAATYFDRAISSDNKLICVDTTQPVDALFRIRINHPGDTIEQMITLTPEVYFDSPDGSKASDSTIGFYRPFSDIIQDIHDEQNLLKRVNHVFSIEPEYVPYLSFLLGWELPYFPTSIDSLRRAVLRNITKLQQLKGSKRAVRELLDLFGFAVNIANVWWTPDGSEFLAPGEEPIGDDANKINVDQVSTTEPLLVEFEEDGFGTFTAPLRNRPLERKVTIKAFYVEKGSDADTFLQNSSNSLTNDFNAYDDDLPVFFDRLPSPVDSVLTEDGLLGATEALIDTDGFVSEITLTGESNAPFFDTGLKFNYVTNFLEASFSRHFSFSDEDTRMYMFAVYGYNKLDIPDLMVDLQSNRFDTIITNKDGSQVDPDIIVFLVDFIFKIKAFHSLLRKIIYTITLDETYLVTDFCLGGEVEQEAGTDAGDQQVPPEAIIPQDPDLVNCTFATPEGRGYRPQDIDYRERILNNLAEEFQAWKDLKADCAANPGGQNRAASQDRVQTTDVGVLGGEDSFRTDQDEAQTTLCELDGQDYCYKGRVTDIIGYQLNQLCTETFKFNLCKLGYGNGLYYTFPSPKAINGNAVKDYIGSPVGPLKYDGLLGRLYRAYSRNDANSLHFTDNKALDGSISPDRFLAIRRPSLNIQKDNMGMPGTRPPRFDALLDDFTHSKWRAKPWDYNTTCTCPEGIQQPDPLNATLELDSLGDQVLIYDDQAYFLEGNGITPDISNYGEHLLAGTGGSSTSPSSTITDPDDVVHAVYVDDDGGHPAITLDNVVSAVGVINVEAPYFESSGDCGSGDVQDFSDGYPATTGYIDDPGDPDYFPSVDDITPGGVDDLVDALCLTPTPGSSAVLLFSWSSGIKVYENNPYFDTFRPVRYDCGCLRNTCDETGGTDVFTQDSIIGCSVQDFIDEYGNIHPDQLEIVSDLVLPEKFGTKTHLHDGKTSYFDLLQSLVDSVYQVDEHGDPGPTPFPANGMFSFKDEYGIIYEIFWETVSPFIDMVIITKDPTIPGQDPQGRIINRERYATGIVTTTRHIFEFDPSEPVSPTNMILTAEGTSTVIEEFQSTFLCDKPFTDPFIWHYCNDIVDTVEHAVTMGPKWEVAEPVSDPVLWADADAGNDSDGEACESLLWIDIYSNNDPLNCP